MYKIELKPHKGIQRSMFGPIEVEHDQWMIYANGLHVGYVGKQEGAPINIFAEMHKSMLSEMKKCIEQTLGRSVPVVMPPTDQEVAEHFKSLEKGEEDE